MKKVLLSVLSVIVFLFGLIPTISFAASSEAPASARQIIQSGGENGKEHIDVSKTIEGTETENVFDITLQVRTQESIEEQLVSQDAAVVIVMDISHTMRNALSSGESRYNGAMAAAKLFLNSFCEKSKAAPNADLKVGFVAFNTDAHSIFPLQTCSSDQQLSTLISAMENSTSSIINSPGYESSYDKYTNIESGLWLGDSMLDTSDAANKYLIFLSDGFPTTYMKSGNVGYRPHLGGSELSSFMPDSQGNIPLGAFYDEKTGRPCSWGVDYSDRAADRAQSMAASIKAEGTKIFSVGVGLDDQSIQAYIDRFADENFSTVDCYKEDPYVIGSAQGSAGYKAWLKNSIASGYYYDSNDSAALQNAFSAIFEEIKVLNEEKVKASWAVSDPMNADGNAYIEFISFYDKDGAFARDRISLSGTLTEGGENTASVNGDTISWNLWSSGYSRESTDSGSSYSYRLKYRVRIKNEVSAFPEGTEIPSNGPTSASYIHELNGVMTPGSIDFPLPSLEAYLGDFSFKKLAEDTGDSLAGAEFTLSHKADCATCAEIYPGGWPVAIGDIAAVSSKDGTVSFENIPSGHEYALSEAKAPEGYESFAPQLPVGVSYGLTEVEGLGQLAALSNKPLSSLTVSKELTGILSKGDFSAGSFTIELINQSGETAASVQLPKEENGELVWQHTFTGLPSGSYTLRESAYPTIGEGYHCEVSYLYPDSHDHIVIDWNAPGTATVSNHYSYEPATAYITAYKHWADDTNRDGLRPESVSFTLYAGETELDTKAVDVPVEGSPNSFSAEFSYDARLYPEGTEFTVRESGYTDAEGFHSLAEGQTVPGYSMEQNGLEITNLHTPQAIALKLEKKWTDEASENTKAVTFRLLADGKEINSVTLDGTTGWEYEFNEDKSGAPLYAYSDGVKINYSITEDSLGEFWSVSHETEGQTWTITNDYHVPKAAEVRLVASKYFGGAPAEGSLYTFTLSDSQGNTLQSVKNNGSLIEFKPLKFTKPGVYVYEIREKKGSDNSIRYDKTVYTVTVQVEAGRDYTAAVTYQRNGEAYEGELKFNNRSKLLPATGDNSNMTTLALAMLLSASLIAVIIIIMKKKYPGHRD